MRPCHGGNMQDYSRVCQKGEHPTARSAATTVTRLHAGRGRGFPGIRPLIATAPMLSPRSLPAQRTASRRDHPMGPRGKHPMASDARRAYGPHVCQLKPFSSSWSWSYSSAAAASSGADADVEEFNRLPHADPIRAPDERITGAAANSTLERGPVAVRSIRRSLCSSVATSAIPPLLIGAGGRGRLKGNCTCNPALGRQRAGSTAAIKQFP